MQSTSNGNMDNGDKSLAEWPTLGDVSGNVKQPPPTGACAKNPPTDTKRTTSPSEHADDDSAKENEDSAHHSNGRGARRKGSRQKWKPVTIEPPPYRKRFERNNNNVGKPNYDQGGFAVDGERPQQTNGFDKGSSVKKADMRYRGKRGRGFSRDWRQRREEVTSRGEVETPSDTTETPSEPEYVQTMYYDPFTHSHYESVTRRNELKKAIRIQIEYYFSEENLVKDFYMRRRMDANGYVALSLVADFHRVKNLTSDFFTIVEAINESDKLEVLEDEKVRPVVNPLKWPLPDYSELRPDVPDFVPGQPYFTVSSVIESMQNFSLYSPEGYEDSNASSTDGMENGVAENYFENMMQNTAVEAT